jgi:competence protein ComEC
MRGERRNQFENPKPLPAPLVPVAGAVIIGIIAARQAFIPTLVWVVILAGLVIVSGALIFFLWSNPGGRGVRCLVIILLGVGFACGAALRYQLIYHYYPDNHIIYYCHDQPRLATLRGDIVTEPYIVKGKGAFADYLPGNIAKTIFTLRCDRVKTWQGWQQTDGLVHVVVNEAHLLARSGQKVEIDGWISLRRGNDNPGQRNRQDYYRAARNLVACRVNVAEGVTILADIPEQAPWLSRLRRKIQSLAYTAVIDDLYAATSDGDITSSSRSAHQLAQQKEVSGFLSALLLGQRYQLSTTLNETFMRTGTMHFLSVSGLHVGLLAGFVWWLGWLIGLDRRWQGILTLITVILFVCLIPTRAPIVRAGIVCSVFCLAYITRRRSSGINLLALAAMVLLLWRPLELFSAGFQLSFVVVLGLLLFAGPILTGKWLAEKKDSLLSKTSISEASDFAEARPWWRQALRFIGRWLVNLAMVALVAWVVALPLTAYHFNRIAPWGPLGSVVMFPLIGLTMLFGFAKLLVAAVAPILAYPLGTPLEVMGSVTIHTGKLLATLPFSNINTAAPPVWFIMIFYALLGWGALRIRLGSGLSRLILVGLLIWAAAFIWLAPFSKPLAKGQSTRMDVLSVGQGTAVVLKLPDDKVICYDIGSMGAFDVGSYTVAPFLRSQGIQRLDALFISHPNLDHYSGVLDLCAQMDVGTVYISEYYDKTGGALSKMLLEKLSLQSVPICGISRGFSWESSLPTKNYQLEVLWPPKFDPSRPLDSNDGSLVIRVADENGSILLTGDIGPHAQQSLLELVDNENLSADVLLLPHHGAITDTLPDFVQAIDPQVCVNSCGKIRDRTNEELHQLLPDRKIMPTSVYGAISIALTPDGLVVKTFRESEIVDE